MELLTLLKSTSYKLGFSVALFALCALLGLSFNTPLNAGEKNHQQQKNLELGLSLETKFWNAVQKGNDKRISSMLSPIFQGLSISGPYTRKQQIDGLAGTPLIGFGINQPEATRSGKDLVFSYMLVAIGDGITSGPQVTVWRKKGSSWEIISHSYVPFLVPG